MNTHLQYYITCSILLATLVAPQGVSLAESGKGGRFIDQTQAEYFKKIDNTLAMKERDILEELAGRGETSRSGTVAQVSEKLGTPAISTPTPPEVSFRPVVGESVDLDIEAAIQKMELQQGELDTLVEEFSGLEQRSRNVEEQIAFVEDSLQEVGSEKLLAAIQGEGFSQLEETPAGDESAIPTGPLPFDLPHAGVNLADKPLREIPNEVLYFQGKRIPSSMPLARVNVKSVAFRAGPANTYESLFQANEGEVIAIEKRYDNWFRVIHESGIRGWVADKEIIFGKNSRELPGRIIRIRAYDIGSDKTDWEDVPEVESGVS